MPWLHRPYLFDGISAFAGFATNLPGFSDSRHNEQGVKTAINR
jgi:hypothetical protein